MTAEPWRIPPRSLCTGANKGRPLTKPLRGRNGRRRGPHPARVGVPALHCCRPVATHGVSSRRAPARGRKSPGRLERWPGSPRWPSREGAFEMSLSRSRRRGPVAAAICCGCSMLRLLYLQGASFFCGRYEAYKKAETVAEAGMECQRLDAGSPGIWRTRPSAWDAKRETLCMIRARAT